VKSSQSTISTFAHYSTSLTSHNLTHVRVWPTRLLLVVYIFQQRGGSGHPATEELLCTDNSVIYPLQGTLSPDPKIEEKGYLHVLWRGHLAVSPEGPGLNGHLPSPDPR